MKTTHLFPTASLALALLSTLNSQLSTCLAQGSLSPPGAPYPTMKTLAQIEPRTPISSVPYTITVPGSYYLTTNLTVVAGDAITIAANGVTLDLNGFTISSTANPATNTGILLNAVSDITIGNGHIRGGVTNNGSGVYSGIGFGQGITCGNATVQNVLVSRVSVAGCRYNGITLNIGNSTVVDSCAVQVAGGIGILATAIKGSVAVDCGNAALYGYTVADSRGACYSSDNGIYAFTVQNSFGSSPSKEGILAYSVLNCYGSSGSSYGLYSYGIAQNCYGYSTSGTALYVESSAQNCYGRSGSGDGLRVNGVAENCWGMSNGNGNGVNASSAHNCYGYSSSGPGVYVYGTAENCYGNSTGSGGGVYSFVALNCYGNSGGNGIGLSASYAAQNCYGYSSSGSGLSSGWLAQNCLGSSGGSGTGLAASSGVAMGCVASSTSGVGLSAYIANSCRVTSGSTSVTYKYNMP